MPATVHELFDNRTEILADKSSAEVPYLVRGAADEAEVKTALIAAIPLTYVGMEFKSLEIAERITLDAWKVVVRYATRDPREEPETGESVFSFDTGGGTQHITQSIQTIARYPAAAADLQGAIGFDGENVNGVDIAVPVYNFSETHYFADAAVDAAYKGVLFQTTGKVNADAFKGFSPGEVLFLGASGSKRGAGDWEISFKFAASPNKTGLSIGAIAGIAKKGWEYLWVRYGEDVDAAAKQRIKKPLAVYIEKVYDEIAFAPLGI